MATNDSRPEARSWIWIGSLWLGLGLFDAMQTVLVMRSEGMHHAWARLFLVTVISWLPWALATPLIVRLGRAFSPLRLRPYSTWFVHIAAAAAIGFIFAGWTTLLHLIFNPYADLPAPPGSLALWLDKSWNGMLSSLLLYAWVLTVSYGLESRARLASSQTETARLSEGLSKAQLNALRRQIEPHFLFNTLNSVAGLVREGRNDAAVSMIAALSDFLRRMLDDSNRQEVPLREEMEFVRSYLDIQKVRFADRLHVSVDVPSELDWVPVPNLILQPLVENAIKHGIAKRALGGAIRITASRCDDTITLCVYNDGPSLPADWESARPGIGLSNVRTRLRSLYGVASAVSMRNAGGGVEVEVALPLRGSPAVGEAALF